MSTGDVAVNTGFYIEFYVILIYFVIFTLQMVFVCCSESCKKHRMTEIIKKDSKFNENNKNTK